MCLALFELNDCSSEQIIDDFQLANANSEGSVFLLQLVVGFGRFKVAVILRRGGTRGWVAEVESG